jgi:uncharacterized surface protein with fasciclin (FAS1) repeats
MNRRSKLLLLVLSLVVMIGILPAANVGATAVTRVRVAHFSPDAPAVTIFLDGAPAGIQDLSFGNISGWVEIPAGSYSVAVVPVGAPLESAAIGPVNLSFRAGAFTTIAAIGSLADGTLTATTINENYRPIEGGEARVTVFHGIEDAPNVDVILPDGTQIVRNLRFGQSQTVTVPAGGYDLRVVPAGASSPVVINLAGTNLEGANYYFVAATNRLAAPQVALSVVSLGTVAPIIRDQVGHSTIAQIVAGDNRFDTLLAAVSAAGLVDTLNGPGPFTVFAPTDAAFAALPAGTLDAVLADKTLLTNILTYHVASGRIPASEVVRLSGLDMLRGRVSIEVRDGNVFLNGNVQVIITDIPASNGIVHVINAVLIP